jgi:hypothetical protein
MFVNKFNLVIYMCITLLFTQWSGLHIHIDMDSLDSSSHISKLHGFDVDEHDHGSEVDVELQELSSSVYKLIHLFVLVVFIIVAANLFAWSIIPPPSKLPFYRRLDYWRPILRAPPIPNSSI